MYWFEACWAEMEPVTAAKMKAIINYKQIPTRQNLALRAAKNRAQRTVRYCANEYCLKLCENKQSSAEAGYTIGMYVNINKVIGPFENNDSINHYRPQQTDGQMGGALP